MTKMREFHAECVRLKELRLFLIDLRAMVISYTILSFTYYVCNLGLFCGLKTYQMVVVFDGPLY